MTQEEKARAYDEALKVLHKYDGANIMFTQDLKEEMFPELKESEDERIRKEMITYLSTVEDKELIPYERWIVWLEKQGEHAKFRDSIQVGDKVTRNQDGVLVNLSQLKRIAKPAENKGKHNMGISEVTKQELEDNLNKALEKETPESCNEFLDEQKPAWSEEDEVGLGDALWCCKQAASIAKDENDMGNIWYAENWLKSLKERVQQQQQEWSKEDDYNYGIIQYILNNECVGIADKKIAINWFKFLKDRYTWKPSDEQMNTLEYYMHTLVCNEHKEILFGLYADLKKLREE